MPEVGSSRKTMPGLPRKAMATLSFLLCPPDSSSALVLPFSASPAHLATSAKKTHSQDCPANLWHSIPLVLSSMQHQTWGT